MRIVKYIKPFDFLLLLLAILIAFASLYFSHSLSRDLSEEERVRVEIWAEALRNLQMADETTDLTMVLKVLNANNTIPVVVIDQDGVVHTYRNVAISEADTLQELQKIVRDFERDGNALTIDLNDDEHMKVLYGNSLMIKRLSIYPYLQLTAVLVFVSIAIFALLSAKRAEQNKVWVGLSKETAHQLGTPISSLMAWVELLKSRYPQDDLLPSMGEDVERLQMIADRFSKIGSVPELDRTDLHALVGRVAEYIRHRVSDKITLSLQLPGVISPVSLNAPLFEWVLENLCKNAVDAMDGAGVLTISVSENDKFCFVDVADTGRGIEKRHYRDIFSPGYTTKKRGWGLGLSLARRIVVEYHYGRIYVKHSELNKGTIFRIELKK